MSESEKVALVTGGSRGLGRAIAFALAEAGLSVNLSYQSNQSQADEAVEQIHARGGKAHALKLDVRDAAATKAAIDEIVKTQGRLDVLVANAGISIDGLLLRFKDEDLRALFETNVFGAFFAARAAARPLMKSPAGRIIFIGSVVGEMGNVGQSAYAATKSALDGMAKSMARELASRKITVNVVAPGFIETDMTHGMTESMKAQLLATIPLGQVGRPEDIAHVVRFLASDAARYMTGQVIEVNGGLHMG